MTVRSRRVVWETVQSQPGIHKTDLANRTGLSWGTVGHHLRMLERDGLVDMVRVGRTVHVAPVDFTRRLGDASVLTAPEVRQVLLLVVGESFARGATELGRMMGLTRKQVRRHLHDLMDAGLVEADGNYHPRYRATEAGAVQSRVVETVMA